MAAEAVVAREGPVGMQAAPGGGMAGPDTTSAPQQTLGGAFNSKLAYSNGGPSGSGTVSGSARSGAGDDDAGLEGGGLGGGSSSPPESTSPRSMRGATMLSRAVLWPDSGGEVSILQPPAPRRPLPFPAVSDSEEEEEEEAGRGPSTWDVRRDWGSSSDEEGEAPPEPAATPAVDLGPAFPNPGTDRLPARPLPSCSPSSAGHAHGNPAHLKHRNACPSWMQRGQQARRFVGHRQLSTFHCSGSGEAQPWSHKEESDQVSILGDGRSAVWP